MEFLKLPQIDAALIKVIGVFSFNTEDISKFINIGYQTIPLTERPLPIGCSDPTQWRKDQIDSTKRFYRDTYYPEFASLMLTGDSDNRTSSLKRSKSFELTWSVKYSVGNEFKEKTVKAIGICQELFLFSQYNTGIFALTFQPELFNFYQVSDIINGLRSFDTEMHFGEKLIKFHDFISMELLGGHQLCGENVQVDRFSGSKFKIYSIISTIEDDDDLYYERDFLTYEIGTNSRIGEIGSKGYNSPSEIYFDELFKNSIKVFRNYTGLALLDSFTVIGKGIYKSDKVDYFSYNNYNRVYFA
ncbi:MAG: hypothetical protein ACK5D8_04240, partial [Bacteroidota bacterium]